MFKYWLRNTTIAAALAFTPLPLFAQDAPKQGGEIVITYKDDIYTCGINNFSHRVIVRC